MDADRYFALVECVSCGRYRPAGAPDCAACTAWIDEDIAAAWGWRLRMLGIVGNAGERELAEAVWVDPRNVPWRVVDAAMLRLRCADDGHPLGTGPGGCGACRLAHGHRFLAAEPDRRGVPLGNEHAVRVSTVVARWPQWSPAHMVRLYASSLPLLLAGDLPTIRQAQAIKGWLDRGGDRGVLSTARSLNEMHRKPSAGC